MSCHQPTHQRRTSNNHNKHNVNTKARRNIIPDNNDNNDNNDISDDEDTTVECHSSHPECRLHKVNNGKVYKPTTKSRSKMSSLDKHAHKHSKLNTWAPEVMKQAMDFFQATRKDDTPPPNILEIADKFGLPYTMLWKRINCMVQGTDHQSGGKNVPSVFPAEDEKEFASIISDLGECGFSLTEEDIRSMFCSIQF